MRDEFGGGTPSDATLAYLRSLPFDLAIAHGRTVGVVDRTGRPGPTRSSINRTTHVPDVLRGDLAEACSTTCSSSAIRTVHSGINVQQGLAINPGSVVSMPVVDSSRTFAMVDLETLESAFFDVETGRQVELPPWE